MKRPLKLTISSILPVILVCGLNLAKTYIQTPDQRNADTKDISSADRNIQTVWTINRPRPLLEFVSILQKRTSVPISYEDPIWVYETDKGTGDIIRAKGMTDEEHSPNLRIPDLIRLASGKLSIPVTVLAKNMLVQHPEEMTARLLGDAVGNHSANRNPGVFSFVDLADSGFDIIPLQVRNSAGQWTQTKSPLDSIISFPTQERSSQETISLIAQLASQESGIRVEFDASAKELPLRQTVVIGARNTVARNVLAQTLRDIKRGDPGNHAPVPKRSWRLIFDIHTSSYVLELESVRLELFNESGKSIGKSAPISWPQ
jgi:hypothetical protein